MIDTDTPLLAERVGQLETEKKQLIADNEKLKKERDAGVKSAVAWEKWSKAQVFGTNLILALVFFGAAVGVVVFIIKVLAAPHIVDHCYVDTGQNHSDIHLYGNVEWSPDDDLGKFDTADNAAQAAERIKCPLFVGPKSP